jgi:hypothetical protein
VKPLPKSDQALVLRTDFSDAAAWQAIRSATMTHPEHPVLVLDLFDLSSQAFRALPSAVQSIENNLSISNMDFEEFAGAVDEDGVFRGFPSN